MGVAQELRAADSATGTLVVIVRPARAEVSVNGTFYGEGNKAILHTPPGQYTVAVAYRGFVKSEPVTVRAGAHTTVSLRPEYLHPVLTGGVMAASLTNGHRVQKRFVEFGLQHRRLYLGLHAQDMAGDRAYGDVRTETTTVDTGSGPVDCAVLHSSQHERGFGFGLVGLYDGLLKPTAPVHLEVGLQAGYWRFCHVDVAQAFVLDSVGTSLSRLQNDDGLVYTGETENVDAYYGGPLVRLAFGRRFVRWVLHASVLLGDGALVDIGTALQLRI
jgi:hypothetical protein